MLGQQEWIAIQNAPVQAQASFAVNTKKTKSHQISPMRLQKYNKKVGFKRSKGLLILDVRGYYFKNYL